MPSAIFLSRSHRKADGAARRKIDGVAPGPHLSRPPPAPPTPAEGATFVETLDISAVLHYNDFRAREHPSRTHAPVAQLDRVSDSDSEGHRFDSCRVYHNSRRVTRREFLLTRAGVLPFADAVCAAAALFPAPHPVDPRHGNKLPRTSFTFTAQPRYSVLAPLRPYDSCRVYHTGIIRTRNKIRGSYYSLQRAF